MSKQQTAVEWLVDELDQLVSMLITNQLSISRYNELQNKLLEQAKQMEKEQIRDAFNAGDTCSSDFFIPFLKSMDESEVYYESKYGKDENKSD